RDLRMMRNRRLGALSQGFCEPLWCGRIHVGGMELSLRNRTANVAMETPVQDNPRSQPATSLTKRVSKFGRPLSVDTHRNMLAESKSFLGWCVARKWLEANPLDEVNGKGKRRHGKPQLRIDEIRRWVQKAFELADQGSEGAVAALITVYLGLRATEITRRVVRDVDDRGSLLVIENSKTAAGNRTLEIPAPLKSYLLPLTVGKKPDDLLFGQHWRDWPTKQVRCLCKLAGVPAVCAHSMRGLHASL